MQLNRLPEWAARLTVAAFSADFLTMLLMNTLRLYTHWMPVLFFCSLAAAGAWIFRSSVVQPRWPDSIPSKERMLLALLTLGIALLISGTRIPYFLEGSLHHLVSPIVYDDTWHFQEINSLVNSVRYPAQYNLMPGKYFSLYYAPWVLIAALYRALPVNGFTIKAAFFLGCAIYNVLLCLTLLYLGFARARNRKHLYWAIYLIVCWAGGASIFAMMHPLRDDNWWMGQFGFHIQFSCYLVTAIWSIHHLSAAVALLLCWHVWDTEKTPSLKTVLWCSLLLCYGFYASIFVFLGALPLGLVAISTSRREQWKHIAEIIFLSGAMDLPMLWLYLGRSSKARFLFPFITHLHLSFFRFPRISTIAGGIWFGLIVFLVVLCVNFLPHLLAISFSGKKLTSKNKILVTLIIIFLISTYFIGFTEGNNYATRSSLVPIMVLGWICADLLPAIRPSAVLVFVLLIGSFGSLQEGLWAYRQAWLSAHVSPAGEYDRAILAINRDRNTSQLPLTEIKEILKKQPDSIYFIERFVPGGKTQLVNADFELECKGPRGPWRWESIPEVPVH
jgi:hypothetical protein